MLLVYPEVGTSYCDGCVCVSAHISGIMHPVLIVASSCGLPLRWCCNRSCTSSFVDDVVKEGIYLVSQMQQSAYCF